mmetsp:Transcript_21421/g.29758  ORF Transcript_21421/g.29758 Transcript_21421/m.29758 type:complete len:87 (+) Transcript_21421:603-863(+)
MAHLLSWEVCRYNSASSSDWIPAPEKVAAVQSGAQKTAITSMEVKEAKEVKSVQRKREVLCERQSGILEIQERCLRDRRTLEERCW